jgi:hypothetical protein
MAVLETAVLLGPAIARGIIKIFLRDNVAKELVPDLVELVLKTTGARVSQARKQAERFAVIGTRVAGGMQPLWESEYRGIEDNSRRSVIEELVETLQIIEITAQLLTEFNLDAAKLEQYLLDGRPKVLGWSEAERDLYRRLLGSVSHAIVQEAPHLPGFAGSVAAAALGRLDSIERGSAQLRDEQTAVARTFEAQYRRAVEERLDRLEYFGIPQVDEKQRGFRVSVAYITLHMDQLQGRQAWQVLGRSLPLGSVDEVTRAAERGRSVDECLGIARRLVIRGEAGSGKTTLMQWMAVQAARKGFTGQLAELNDVVPFFIRLRERSDRGFPAPEDWPGLLAPMLMGEMPTGWVREQLRRERALVLVDGVDELPQAKREVMLGELRQLMDAYPRARYILTSRPSVLKGEVWPEWEEFVEQEQLVSIALQALGSEQIGKMIVNWHEAAAQTALAREYGKQLQEAAANLQQLLQTRPVLRRLAASPLLCTMICALHLDRGLGLPSDRVKLYGACVEMLLSRRDEKRGVKLGQEYPSLTEGQRERLAEELAYWMVDTGQSEADRDDVDAFFDDRLRNMQPQGMKGDQVRAFFVDRSGLLREPVTGQIDFVHRTLQEYLAARRAIAGRSIDVLPQNWSTQEVSPGRSPVVSAPTGARAADAGAVAWLATSAGVR